MTEPELSPRELAGYLLWYCGGRGCAVAYAIAAQYPEVAAVLRHRTELPYTPPQRATGRHDDYEKNDSPQDSRSGR